MAAQSTYSYRARDGGGAVVTGTMVAATAQEVGARLRSEGKYILSVEDKPLRASAKLDTHQVRRNEAAKRVRRDDVVALCQQLSIMLETGVPISEALDAFCAQTPRKEFRQVLNVLRDDIHSGESLSTSMAKWPSVFPLMMVSLMKASEASGTMALMLGRVGNYLSKERRTARQIKGALTYPLFMMIFAVAITTFLMAFVLPRFAKIYAQRSATLPVPTKVLIAMSDFMTHQYMYYGPVALAVVVMLVLWVRRPSGKRVLDWLKLHTPVLRTMFSQLYLTRIARTMATLLNAGVNLLDIIDICRGVTDNTYYARLWNQMERDVRAGKQISDTVFESKIIPPNVASMISAGERSGRLSQVMERVSEFSEQELDTAVKSATAYIEPIMIMAMGLLVGGIAMALLLPIFSMGKVLSGAH